MQQDYRKLAALALEARRHAYVPYSGFAVGAALLADSGKTYWGCNIENAAYTPTNCAERTAIFEAVKLGERDFSAIAICGGKQEQAGTLPRCTPCGVCLQVMLEFCDPDEFDVVLVRSETEYEVHKLREMVPFGFGKKDLA